MKNVVAKSATQQRAMTHDEVVEWSMAMVPKLLHRACEAERLRELPQVTIDDAEAVGLFKMVVPAPRSTSTVRRSVESTAT